MQFIPGGPDIPDALLQAHEDGRVVFFCGAGISCSANLPGFNKLVKQLYDNLGITPNRVQAIAIRANQYDMAIGLLEDEIAGGRESVRQAIANILLKPDPNATDTHEALLRLAKNRDQCYRLVTTNYDRLFEKVISDKKWKIEQFRAPLLPVPKNKWDGLVYLHGLLTPTPTASDLDRLVVSSGDFGLAYLIERWAARFVSELFRRYTICFVGYSINDPVMRYMLDALAADRQLGESPPEMFVFGSYSEGQKDKVAEDWRAKNVTPILYREYQDHSYLHRTLWKWAEIYRDGISGKESIVAKYAALQPSASTQQDDYVGRMWWALLDKSGISAIQFAKFNPVPPLEWLFEVFSDKRFGHNNLLQFDVPSRAKTDNDLKFSLIDRPAPYDKAPWMRLVSGGNAESDWDNVMLQLARWLNRYLGDPRLVIWIAQHGGKLHARWQILIEQELNRLVDFERAELGSIREQSPKAIPSALMRILWGLLLGGRVKGFDRSIELYRWKSRFEREELTTSLRFELRELLSPRIVLRPCREIVGNDMESEPTQMRQLVNWQLELAANDVYSILHDPRNSESWKSGLPLLLEDFQQLLRDALDLMRDLGDADDKSDRSFWDLPSITPHDQNRGYRKWVVLIELLRDAWLALLVINRVRATRIAQDWFELPYPTFKRLALFAASQPDCIAPQQWVDWLLVDDAWWLWSAETNREVCRLLAQQGKQLPEADQERLEVAVLACQPQSMLMGQPEPDWWEKDALHAIWLRLVKLDASGLSLGAQAAARLNELSNMYPQWKLTDTGVEREEFSRWMSRSGDPEFESRRVVDVAPRTRKDLVLWLNKPPAQWSPFYEDTWQQTCRKHPLNSLYALYDLAKKDVWLADRWNQAFYVWSQGRLLPRLWRYVPRLLGTIPDGTNLQEIAYSLSWWLETVSKSIDQQEDVLLEWCRRVLDFDLHADSGARTVRNGVEIIDITSAALNHPVGHVTQALLNVWFKRKPNDGDGLPSDIKLLFTDICTQQIGRFRYGRVVLASQVIALFRADHEWTEKNLLPWFSWSSPTDAQSVWQGFFWAPRVHQPLLVAIKRQFLDCADHYADLGEYGPQFAAFLTIVALEKTEGFTIVELRTAMGMLPPSGLEACAQALLNALGGAGDQREVYWKNRILPFCKVWPKSRDLITPKISEFIALLCISSGDEFPAAIKAVEFWLQPLHELSIVVRVLHKSGLCSRFPADALHLLHKVIGDTDWILAGDLCDCLKDIAGSTPELEDDQEFIRLNQLCTRLERW